MLIEYRRYETPRARTWFAKIRRADTEWLKARITEALAVVCQFSVDPHSAIWHTATDSSTTRYGRSGWHRGRNNNLISVIGGALCKITAGLDLTEKQILQVTEAFQQLHHMDTSVFSPVQFKEVTEYTSTGSSIEDLRQRLFDDA